MNPLLQSHGNEFPKKKVSLQKILGAFSILVLPFMLWGNQALAVPVHGSSALGELTGSRSVGSGLIGTNNYNNTNLTLSWVIAPSGSNFVYTYTLTNLPMDISHFTLEVSPDCIDDGTCIFSVTGFPAPLSTPVEFGIKDGITNAVKLDFGGDNDPTFMYSFTSDRAPVYHDVCGVDGGGPDTCADIGNIGNTNLFYNVGFGDSTSDNVPVTNYIAAPNSGTNGNGGPGVIPEPSTILLFGSGLAGLVAWRMRKGRA